jgi:hypothetical protein
MVGTNPTGAYVLYSDYAALEQRYRELEDYLALLNDRLASATARCRFVETENAELRKRLQTGGLDN